MNETIISQYTQWAGVAPHLVNEQVKLAAYDRVIMPLLAPKVLDYGAGPGVLASAMQKAGLVVSAFDISEEMRVREKMVLGSNAVYDSANDIPHNYFDIVVCNLVLCIVPEAEVKTILQNIRTALASSGRAYIGFCNPKIFQVEESQLDFRFPTGIAYEENHRYRKIKKEGGYEIIEDHRPVTWYETQFKEAGLQLLATHFTAEYKLNEDVIKDFVIFELTK